MLRLPNRNCCLYVDFHGNTSVYVRLECDVHTTVFWWQHQKSMIKLSLISRHLRVKKCIYNLILFKTWQVCFQALTYLSFSPLSSWPLTEVCQCQVNFEFSSALILVKVGYEIRKAVWHKLICWLTLSLPLAFFLTQTNFCF